MEISIEDTQSDLSIKPSQVKALVKAVLQFEGQTCDEVGIHFVNALRISELHAHYFDDPTLTDCISFPIDKDSNSPYRVLGEVFVCPKVAMEYAAAHAKDPYEEVTLYLVHGLLHLMGYDDIEDRDRRQMRAAEKRHMKNLQQLKLYLHT
jgi:probable rRNA maturation factor